ncbi:MAG: hypothetical protein ED559_10405 [Phycisphaera sp.]|nr:MAG: hypothetical protein ED559_10405 [Phycisphaera sp.]
MGPTSNFARFRPILTTVLLIIALFVLWISIEVYFALTATPNPVIDYGEQLEKLVAESQAGREGEDVWPVFMETFELVQSVESDAYDTDAVFAEKEVFVDYDLIYRFEERLADIDEYSHLYGEDAEYLGLQRQLSLEALSRYEEVGVISRLDEIAASGVGVMPMPDSRDEMLIMMDLTPLAEQRRLAKALRARMYLAVEQDDWETYTESFEHILAIGRLTGEQPFLIQRLVGIAIRSLALGAVTDDLMAGRLEDSALQGLGDAIERQGPMLPVEFAFRSELLWELDAVQWMHTKRGRLILSDGGKLDWSGASRPKIVNVASLVFPRKAETEQWFREFHEMSIARSRLTPAERREQPVDPSWFEFSWQQYLQGILVPAMGSMMRTDEQARLIELGLRVMLAIERYRADQGALPGDLASLVPDYLEELPLDRYALGEVPLGYLVLDYIDEQGRDFLLYSVGADGEDNGGQPHESNPMGALQSGAPGTDYVINQKIN